MVLEPEVLDGLIVLNLKSCAWNTMKISLVLRHHKSCKWSTTPKGLDSAASQVIGVGKVLKNRLVNKQGLTNQKINKLLGHYDLVFLFHLSWPPKEGQGCLMSPRCLESQGCHLIPLCYLLSCSSAWSCYSFCLIFFCLLVHSSDLFPESFQYVSLRDMLFCMAPVWRLGGMGWSVVCAACCCAALVFAIMHLYVYFVCLYCFCPFFFGAFFF